MTVFTRLRNQASSANNELDVQSSDVGASFPPSVAPSVAPSVVPGSAQDNTVPSAMSASEGEEVLRVAGITGDGRVAMPEQAAARQRLAHLIDSGAVRVDDLMQRATNRLAVVNVAANCSDPTHLQRAVASIDDEELLARLAIDGASTRIRQLAAEGVNDPERLKLLLRAARGGKDKNVYKIVRQKCDTFLAAEKEAADIQAHIESVCAALERQRYLPFDNLFVPAFEHLSAQWQALAEHANSDCTARAEQALAQCRAVVDKHADVVAAQAAHAAAVERADADREQLLSDLQQALVDAYTGATNAVALSDVRSRWEHLAQLKSAEATSNERFAALCKAVGAVRAQLEKYGSLEEQATLFRDAKPESDLDRHAQALQSTLDHAELLDETPDAVDQAADAVINWRHAHDQGARARAHLHKQLGGLLRAANAALRKGQSRQAAGLRRAIEEKWATLTQVPEALAKQLAALDEKLKELQDWRSYAVAPKRIELIESMEALIGAKLGPNKLADRIKSLQDEWKSISKGITENTDAEWQRFHQAAQTAFEPCRLHFEAQAQARANNLGKRKELLTRLTTFAQEHDWEHPNWREVAKAVFESQQMWRRYQPVERAANKSVQSQFDAVLADLQARLNVEHEKNAVDKRRLIARAQGLLKLDDLRKATDEVKQLQTAWKNVGPAARADEQSLWEAFRGHCDAVFARRQQHFSEQQAVFDAAKANAVAICEEAEQLSTLDGGELVEAAKQLSALRERFDELGQLPKANARDLHARFDKAINAVRRRIDAQRAQEKAAVWDRVLVAGDCVRRYRLALVEGSDAEEIESRKQAAQAYFDAEPNWPKGVLQKLKAELAATPVVEASADHKANFDALRMLCIRAEVLTDLPTPDEDQSLRRSYQMQRLTQGLGAEPDDLESLVLEWIKVGPTDDATHAQLLQRFKQCRDRQRKRA